MKNKVEELFDIPVSQGRSMHEKEWLFFSGLLITEDDKKDSSYINGNTSGPILVIESVDTDYDNTLDIEFDYGNEIFSVDSKHGLDLRELHDYLQQVSASEMVDVVARVYEWTPETYSVLMRYSFLVEQLDCSWCDR